MAVTVHLGEPGEKQGDLGWYVTLELILTDRVPLPRQLVTLETFEGRNKSWKKLRHDDEEQKTMRPEVHAHTGINRKVPVWSISAQMFTQTSISVKHSQVS